MSTPQIETAKPQLPSSSEVSKALRIIYTLHYRRGDNPHPMQKNFEASSELKIPQLVERCKTYCSNMSYRFISVSPWLSDLAMDEKKQQQLDQI